jgi:hypothetical protein
MAPLGHDTARPVDGAIYHLSRTKYAKWALAAFGGLLLGAVLLYAYFHGIGRKGYLVPGLLLVGVNAILFPTYVRCLFSDERLILGPDRLQLVKGKDRVVGQVPFENVAVVALNKADDLKSLGLDLHDLKRTDTFWPTGLASTPDRREAGGHDVTLGGDLQVTARALLKEINHRVEAFRSANPTAAAATGCEPPAETRPPTAGPPATAPVRTPSGDYIGGGQSTREYGDDIRIHCPVCGARDVEASTYTQSERVRIVGFPVTWRNFWVICSSCEKHLISHRDVRELVGLPPEAVAPAIRPYTPFIARALAVLSLCVFWAPIVGLAMALVAVFANRRPGLWKKLSWVALGLTGILHAWMLYMLLTEG